MGRPSRLNQQMQDLIISAIQAGATYEIACNYAGISLGTFNNWMHRGRKEYERIQHALDEWEVLPKEKRKDTPKPKTDPVEAGYLSFFQSISEANAVAAVGWLQVIDTAAQQDPFWASWMLKHRYPRDYSGRVTDVADATQNELIVRITYSDPAKETKVIDERGDQGRDDQAGLLPEPTDPDANR